MEAAADYSSTPFAWLDNSKQGGCFWKTCQRSFLTGWDTYSKPWPKAGLMLDGKCYQPKRSARPTNATAFLSSQLLPTATVSGNHNRKGVSPKAGNGLETEVKQRLARATFPTPTTPTAHMVGRLDEWGGSRSREMIAHLPHKVRTGPVNPNFVEWLMGFPTDWTALA